MNLCRTCKYWSKNANTIGSGTCLNVSVWLRVFVDGKNFRTAQNFGCVLHEVGESDAKLFSDEDERNILSDFLSARVEVQHAKLLAAQKAQ